MFILKSSIGDKIYYVDFHNTCIVNCQAPLDFLKGIINYDKNKKQNLRHEIYVVLSMFDMLLNYVVCQRIHILIFSF
jgi:hypothetical protein